jgi:hypothetical protein
MGCAAQSKQTGHPPRPNPETKTELGPVTTPDVFIGTHDSFSRDRTPDSPAQSTASEDDGFRGLVIQRGRVRFSLEAALLRPRPGLVLDIRDIRWISLRGGAGIEPRVEEKDAKDVVAIAESDQLNTEVSLYFVRLAYQPYRPGPGMNDFSHQDLIVFIDPNREDNAYLGIQNPDAPGNWSLTLLPGYGPWLKKEIDLFLRIRLGM